MVDTVGIPFVKDRYLIPASKSILASVDGKVMVLTLMIVLFVFATKLGFVVLTACTFAAALVT
jgi:hypothetical protein